MLQNSPTALRILKSALNADEDGQAGIQVGGPPVADGPAPGGRYLCHCVWTYPAARQIARQQG
jgi:hypothetical protein